MTNHSVIIALALSGAAAACAAPVGGDDDGERGVAAAGKTDDHNPDTDPDLAPYTLERREFRPEPTREAYERYVDFNQNHALYHYRDRTERDSPPLARQQGFVEALGSEVTVDVGVQRGCPEVRDAGDDCEGYVTLKLGRPGDPDAWPMLLGPDADSPDPASGYDNWPADYRNEATYRGFVAFHVCTVFLPRVMMGMEPWDSLDEPIEWNTSDPNYGLEIPDATEHRWLELASFSFFLAEGEDLDVDGRDALPPAAFLLWRAQRTMHSYTDEDGFTCNYVTETPELKNHAWHPLDTWVEEWNRQTNGDGGSGALPAKEDWPEPLRERVLDAVMP